MLRLESEVLAQITGQNVAVVSHNRFRVVAERSTCLKVDGGELGERGGQREVRRTRRCRYDGDREEH